MGDTITHYVSDAGLRMSVAYTTNLVEVARRTHALSPVAAAALGRTMTGALLLANDFKNKEGVSIRFAGDGPLGTIHADAYDQGKVRGYLDTPRVDLPLKGPHKLDVGHAVGKGKLYVTRYSLLRQPYQSAIEIVSGEIAEDLTYYLTVSEQIPSAVSLGVLVNPDESVAAAGGVMVQALPDADDEALTAMEENLRSLGPVSHAIHTTNSAEIIATLSRDLAFRQVSQNAVKWECTCAKERFERALLQLGAADRDELIQDPNGVEMSCHYCKQVYRLSPTELQALYASKG